MGKVDFRKTLRAIAQAVQDDNQDRLLAALGVVGGSIAPRKTRVLVGASGRAKRVRISGIRVSLRDIQGKVGVGSGEMLKDSVRRANIRVGRVSFKIVPSPEMRTRWFAFNAGTKRQVPRSISGVSASLLEQATAKLAVDARDQFVQNANRRPRA